MKKVMCIIVLVGLVLAFGARNSFSGDGDVKIKNILIKGLRVSDSKIEVSASRQEGSVEIDFSQINEGEENAIYVDEKVKEAFSNIGEDVLCSFAKCLGDCLERYKNCDRENYFCVSLCSGQSNPSDRITPRMTCR